MGYVCFCRYFVSLSQVRYEHSYQIKEEIPNGYLLFYFALRAGLEEAGPAVGWAKNMPVACFLGRGRVHSRQAHSVGMWAACYLFNGISIPPSRLVATHLYCVKGGFRTVREAGPYKVC